MALRCIITVAIGLTFLAAPSVAQPSSSSFDSGGVPIHYQTRGTGAAVVLIHGFTGSAQRHFGGPGVIDALAVGYRVIAIDCRGHGESGKPVDPGAYGLEMVKDVVRLLDHLQIQRAHVVGYSMGGGIALQMLVRNPERVLSVSLIGSGWEGDDSQTVKSQLLALADGLEKRDARALIRGVRADGGSGPTDAEVAAATTDLFTRNPPEVLAAVARGIMPLYDLPGDRLRSSTVPVLAIVGEHDVTNLTAARRLAAVVRGAETVVIPGATHASSVRPATVPLLGFLGRHSQ